MATFEIYDRFSHLNDTDVGKQALEVYGAALEDGKGEDEAEVMASNVLERAGYHVNSKGGVSIRPDPSGIEQENHQ